MHDLQAYNAYRMRYLVVSFMMERSKEVTKGFHILPIITGIVLALVLSLTVLFVLSFFLMFTEFPEMYLRPCIVISSILSVALSSFLVSKKKGNHGLIIGSLIGFCYVGVLFLFSSILDQALIFDQSLFLMMAIVVLSGVIGGVTGVNLKSSKRY
jgi:putative membrane protein (TIGR04086 family)